MVQGILFHAVMRRH